MITLSVLGILYTIIGFIIFKKRYGHYDLFEVDYQYWIFLLVCSTFASIGTIIVACIKYLP